MSPGSRPFRGRGPRADVYLFPAVLGSGLGDVEEVLTLGRRLGSDGHPVYLFRSGGRPLPASVDGPWDWPPLERVAAPARASACAVSVSASWGVTAAPRRPGPLGGAGPWDEESAAVERAYGTERTLHVSLEEFARTLTSREQTVERYREGGVPARVTRRRLALGELDAEVERFHREYVRHRGFDVPNVLHLYASFLPSRAFQREFPAAVQVGPIVFPRRPARPTRPAPRGRPRSAEWIVHASPSSSPRLLVPLARALRHYAPFTRLVVRGPAPPAGPSSARWTVLGRRSAGAWARRFSSADLRVVTGSRTLLEALTVGGPFLYFNGVTGRGRSTRRQRPEKLDRLLVAWRRLGVAGPLRRDLADVARVRHVDAVVRRAVRDRAWRASFPPGVPALGYRPPYDRGEELAATAVRALASGETASALVAWIRGAGAPRRSPSERAGRPPRSKV